MRHNICSMAWVSHNDLRYDRNSLDAVDTPGFHRHFSLGRAPLYLTVHRVPFEDRGVGDGQVCFAFSCIRSKLFGSYHNDQS
jgi:hypothetical protein